MIADLEKIEKSLEQRILRAQRITRGKSGARCYRVITSEGRWIAKLFPEKPQMAEWYALVNALKQPHLACAIRCNPVGDREICTIANWIEGVSLEDYLSAHPEEMTTLGAQAARLVKILHGTLLDEAAFGIRFNEILKRKIWNTLEQVERKSVSLPYYEQFREYLLASQTYINPGPITLVHNDLRPVNFIVNGKEVFLVDFENGGIGEYVQDFVTLTTTTPPAFYPFSHGFLTEYMSDGIPEGFFEKNLFYSVLHVLREAAWSKTNSQWAVISRKCENLYCLYDNLSCAVPRWYRDGM